MLKGYIVKYMDTDIFPKMFTMQITNGKFVWDPESTSPTLSNINVEIPAGKWKNQTNYIRTQ